MEMTYLGLKFGVILNRGRLGLEPTTYMYMYGNTAHYKHVIN
jgi:hypothetical protein